MNSTEMNDEDFPYRGDDQIPALPAPQTSSSDSREVEFTD